MRNDGFADFTPSSEQGRALWMSTVAFTVCFAVWTIFSIIGVRIKDELGLSETEFGLLVGTPIANRQRPSLDPRDELELALFKHPELGTLLTQHFSETVVGKLLQSSESSLKSDVFYQMPAHAPCIELKVLHPFGGGEYMMVGEFQIRIDTELNPAGFNSSGGWGGCLFSALNIAEPQSVVEQGETRRRYNGIALEEAEYLHAIDDLLNHRPMTQLMGDIKVRGRALSPTILDPDEFEPNRTTWFQKLLRAFI